MATEAQASAQTETLTEEAGLLDSVLAATKPEDAAERKRNEGFIQSLVAQAMQSGKPISGDLTRQIKAWQADIDELISGQLNAIMHTPEFQKLEGTWRGLHYLVDKSETGDSLKLKVLNVSKKALAKDLERAVEFDQSVLFKKVYEHEYGQLGGHPYGMLVGDYEFGRHPTEDIEFLKKVSGVAAAAHAPFVAAAGPKMFGLDTYEDLNQPRDLAKIFSSVEYATWKAFRESEDSRYVALTLPRVLGRYPYGAKTKAVEEFGFEEDTDGRDHNKYLWMNSAWAYAARVTDAYSKDGWFMRTRGVEGGGKVEGLPVHTFSVDGGVTMKCPTEVMIPDRRENELSNLGFLPLLHCKNTEYAAFIGTQTAQKPKDYFDTDAKANAELSTKLNYMMSVGRFAHYMKVIIRDKVGSFMERDTCERWLNDWIQNYVHPNPETAGEESLAKSPLRAANIEVKAVAGKPGWFQAVAHLRPHFQLEGIDTSMRLVAELPQKGK